MNTSTVVRNIAFLVFGLAVVAVGSERSAQLFLEMRHTDKSQDARIDELETQLRDMRANGAKPVEPARPDDVVHAIPVAGLAARGPADAAVTIVAFLDYQCPFCGRVQQTLRDVQTANRDVRVVVAHNPLPFHKDALSAALIAQCSLEMYGNEAFWNVHDQLFASQRDIGNIVAAAEMHDGRLASCADGAHARAIVEEQQALAKAIGANGTPTFFVNGRELVGAQPLEAFQKAVTRARNDVTASGVPAARYYNDVVLAKAR